LGLHLFGGFVRHGYIGGLLLVGILAIQLPKLLGGSSSSEAAATETTSTVPGQIVAPPVSGTTTATLGATPAAQPTTVSATSKLSSFSVFRPKDPFVQQVATEGSTAGPAGATGDTAGSATGATGGGSTKGPTDAGTQKFSTGPKAAAAATIVNVNGTRQVVEPGARFPASDPLFVLVAEKPQSKSIVVGIVGGAYSGGAKTTTLRVGKPLAFVNTATGARYKITLVSVGNGAQTAPATPQAGN
jgi:hypothetical protein